MPKIQYYDGKKSKQHEVNKELAQGYQEIKRAEWRQEKKVKKYEGASVDALVDSGMQFKDTAEGAEELLIRLEEERERTARMGERIRTLSPKQRTMLGLLVKGFSDTQIAKQFGVSKPAISKLKKKLQNKFEDFLK